MSKLAGKVAVITGGNSGIGLATARLFKEEGATVVINARNEDRRQQVSAELGAVVDDIIPADVSRVEELERFFRTVGERYGKIDILFLNAGVAYFMPLESIDEETFDKQFNINVKGVFFGVQKALPYLREGASVLFTTSVVNQMGMATSNVYAATKAAVRSLARSLSAELIGQGIRVNAISPGPIETPIFGKMGMNDEQLQQMAQGIVSQVPLARFGKPEEVAKLALFIASDDSSFIVGTEIEVDGGMASL
ncbi:MAG: SDR family oxidoreductase [Saprospiraceae bacterium]|nr:SDR family oxidoreductase [Saprospiraceae bacterium]MCB0684764.1 SDR family oxidoreductase [Saprospiraceae bacterium]